jgi:hypothetical protein
LRFIQHGGFACVVEAKHQSSAGLVPGSKEALEFGGEETHIGRELKRKNNLFVCKY